jgi:transcription initiation factor TFIIIB Brf1 subunit/transcription initiation factor TFIIB
MNMKGLKCPDCGSDKIRLNQAEAYCDKCGLVIPNILTDEGLIA